MKTKTTVILHSGHKPWYFFPPAAVGQQLSAFRPDEHGLMWFPGIKYRVSIEVIGYERPEWGGGPTLEEMQEWLVKDAARYARNPDRKKQLLEEIEIAKQHERLKNRLNRLLTIKEPRLPKKPRKTKKGKE